MSETRQPPEGGGKSLPTPPLGRPATHPSGIVPSPIVPVAPGSSPNMMPPQGPPHVSTHPTPGMGMVPTPAPSNVSPPPGPYGPAPAIQGAPNPFHQSQVVGPPPPSYRPKQHTPPQAFAPMATTPNQGIPALSAQQQQQQKPITQPPAPLPGTQPTPQRKAERGTLPAIPVAQLTPQMPNVAPAPPRPTSGTLPITSANRASFPAQPPGPPRIMVQYPQVGSKLVGVRGTYEVRDVIGSGEFGAVYECIGPFDQIYAVKMVRPSNRPYSEVHAEWAREVQRLFSLRHPNVVYIYDSFTHDHLFYLALERCDHALKVMLGSPMQEGLVLEMARQLLAAVQFLHDNDVVHDDLHAGNVLITHTDRPTVKISDFGISHELRGMAAVRPNVVHHAIMAPEILATGYTSRQSDLYQVGLLLYWMLTGESAMNMDVPYQELVRQVSEGEPRQRAESLSTPLGHLIAKMLRRREAFRYTSAREVWADLRELPAWKQRNLFPAK